MFDSIYFNCFCGQSIEAQSKGGECSLVKYDHKSVPRDVARDANRHAPFTCPKCGKRWQFAEIDKERVSLHLIELY